MEEPNAQRIFRGAINADLFAFSEQIGMAGWLRAWCDLRTTHVYELNPEGKDSVRVGLVKCGDEVSDKFLAGCFRISLYKARRRRVHLAALGLLAEVRTPHGHKLLLPFCAKWPDKKAPQAPGWMIAPIAKAVRRWTEYRYLLTRSGGESEQDFAGDCSIAAHSRDYSTLREGSLYQKAESQRERTVEELLKEVASWFKRARRKGAGYKACCPVHNDVEPSLFIDPAEDKILMHCFAGCDVKDMLAAVGHTEDELFVKAPGKKRFVSPIVATFDYQDTAGNVLYRIVRKHPKIFEALSPDGRKGINGIPRVIYSLPEVVKATHVLWLEGEKDVESARRLGFVATCNPFGVKGWRPEYAAYLHGKHVTIIPDGDEAGRKHAEDVAESLAGKAQSVKVLELPNAKDLSEWVENGGTRENLDKLVAEAPKRNEAVGYEIASGKRVYPPKPSEDWLQRDSGPQGET